MNFVLYYVLYCIQLYCIALKNNTKIEYHFPIFYTKNVATKLQFKLMPVTSHNPSKYFINS